MDYVQDLFPIESFYGKLLHQETLNACYANYILIAWCISIMVPFLKHMDLRRWKHERIFYEN